MRFDHAPTAAPGAGEHRLTSGMRLLVAATALLVTALLPPVPGRLLAATYGVLGVYLGYAAAIHLMARMRHPIPRAIQHRLPWLDIGVGAILIAINGWGSVYFFLFFFGIVVSSLRWGFASGVATTAVSLVLFVAIWYAGNPGGPRFFPGEFLTRLIGLAVLGNMIAFRGEYELRSRRRLGLLRDIGTLANPRFGPDRMLAQALESLRAFYDADLCVAILATQDPPGHALRRATRERPDAASQAEEISAALATALLSPGDQLVSFRPGSRSALAVSSAGGTTLNAPALGHPRYREIAELLGVRAYLSVPLRAGSTTLGRVFVADAPAFGRGDAAFLLQAADRIMPTLAHIALVERMATRAAEDERHRIAMDIHDRLIQPYIGLQLGITSLRQLVTRYPDEALPLIVRERVDALADASEVGVQDLRGYIRELRGAPAAGCLLESLRRFSHGFHEATGIEVTLDAQGEIPVDHRLAAEIYSMACEAVSNVRRHTLAPSAAITLRTADRRVVLRVENPPDPGARREKFVPRSIAERATAINGTVRVEVTPAGSTAVVMEVPL